jgi:hypothetical protein
MDQQSWSAAVYPRGDFSCSSLKLPENPTAEVPQQQTCGLLKLAVLSDLYLGYWTKVVKFNDLFVSSVI